MGVLLTKGHFMVDNQQFEAKNIKVNFESLATADSGRTDDGVMHITWVFNRIRKVEIELPPCTSQESAQVLSRVQGKIYNLVYFDPLDNDERLITVYTSNSAADMYSGIIRNGLWQGITFSAIEVAGENV